MKLTIVTKEEFRPICAKYKGLFSVYSDAQKIAAEQGLDYLGSNENIHYAYDERKLDNSQESVVE